MKQHIAGFHEALVDITGLLNRPQADTSLLREAGLELERALFPLLVRLARRGPLGVGELADLAGRDYTTVSRQVARLEALGLASRRASERDARVNEAVVTPAGRRVCRSIDRARDRAMAGIFADWSAADVAVLARLSRRFADDAAAYVRERSG